MPTFNPFPAVLGLALLVVFARPALAFGAGNIASISKVEGENWRHGDLEDALLAISMARIAGGKKFNKLNVSRVYFGNWLRDYSQAIDVGTVKSVSAEAIRLLLCVLGFLTFGFGSGEFEVTAERLGTYRPEDHIDNPKNYADNEDARQYDRRLRGPIDERVELGIDERTGLKNYIANEDAGIMTSAKHVRHLFRRCIELARDYNRNNNKADLYESLRLMGTGLHCLEDYLAHSNYTELALIEMGERDVFPHVGSDTLMRLEGARGDVYPIVTGTFGGVDFLHSVAGEVSDKMTQSEIDELEGTLQNQSRNDSSIIEDLLDKIPDGVLGGGDKKSQMHEIQDNAANSQMQNASISPREPEEFTRYVQDIFRQVMPAIEFHDDIMKSISAAIEKIPILPEIMEQLEEAMSRWTFSIMAPFIVPIVQQIKNELRTGSSEIIQSSKNEQHIVFNDDRCTDPTHSMLSKDHFSNIMNEPAGKTASKVVAWVVPQIMEAWDDENVDIRELNDRIVNGVFHHPAQRHMGHGGAREGRDIMFRTMEEWWGQMPEDAKDEYRRKLSRRGVQEGENHKEGVHDTGHGCCGPLGMHKPISGGGNSTSDRIAGAAVNSIMGAVTGAAGDFVSQQSGGEVKLPGWKQQQQEESSSGSGGFLGKVAGSLLGGSFDKDEKESHSGRRYDNDGGYTDSRTEYGRSEGRYGEAEYSERRHGDGSESSQYRRQEQDNDGRGGYEERTESRRTYGGDRYEERTESRYESSSVSYGSSGYGGRNESSSYGREDSYGQSSGYGRSQDSGYERQDSSRYGRDDSSSGYGRESSGYGRQESSGYGRDESSGYGRQESSGYGRESSGYGREESSGYGREESSGYGRSDDYGRNESRRDDDRRDDRRDDDSGGGFLGGIVRAAGDAIEENQRREGGSRWGF